MAAKKMGLGKGLDSMIPPKRNDKVDNSVNAGTVSKTGETILKINEVEPNKDQPRKNFNEEALQELSDSIKQHGIVQPLVVSKKDDYYEIIAGERRWRAAKMAGLKEIPVVIKDYSPQEIMEVALIENIQREDLNPVEEARAYQRLIKEYDLKQEEVAEKVSKSRTAVTNSLRLLKLDDRVLDMLIEETLSSGHARALLGIADNDRQYETALKVAEENISVRETEKLVKSINNPVVKKTAKKELGNDFIYRDLEEQLKQKIGTKVSINRKTENQGKLEIEYYSQEELEKIIDYFKRTLVHKEDFNVSFFRYWFRNRFDYIGCFGTDYRSFYLDDRVAGKKQ